MIKTYRCDKCDPPCIVKITPHVVILRPVDRWNDVKGWCKDGKLKLSKPGRPKKRR